MILMYVSMNRSYSHMGFSMFLKRRTPSHDKHREITGIRHEVQPLGSFLEHFAANISMI